MSEQALQMAAADYLTVKGVLFNHCPNEGVMKPSYGLKRKRMGVSAGIPDLMIFDRPPKKHQFIGVAIELKVGDNVLSEAQETWLAALSNRNWYTDVIYDIDAFIRLCGRLGW